MNKFIATTLREYLNESESYYGDIKKWYRGVDSKYGIGSFPDSWVWITELEKTMTVVSCFSSLY